MDTVLLSASAAPVPDIVALAASGDPGIVDILGATGTGAFAVATTNVGASASITVSADTGTTSLTSAAQIVEANLPVGITVCRTNPITGACLDAPGGSVTTQINGGHTPTFAVFVKGNGVVPFDPAHNRIFVRFKDGNGVTRDSTSVAVRT